MEKKITVYVVSTVVAEGETAVSKVYPTNSIAKKALETLADFGVKAEITKEKKLVTLA